MRLSQEVWEQSWRITLNCFSLPASVWSQGRGNGSWEWGSQEKPSYGWDVGWASWDTGIQGVCNLTSAWGKHSQGKPICCVWWNVCIMMCVYGGMLALWSYIDVCIDVCVRWDVSIMKLQWCVCVCTVELHWCVVDCFVFPLSLCSSSNLWVLTRLRNYHRPPDTCTLWLHRSAYFGPVRSSIYTVNNEVQNDTDPLSTM